jgi:FKBP-type peptidyl-prolyl cis-trans isomerase FklB
VRKLLFPFKKIKQLMKMSLFICTFVAQKLYKITEYNLPFNILYISNIISKKIMMDKLSYALGLSFGQQLSQYNVSIDDYQSFAKGVEAVLKGLKPEISLSECQAVLDDYFNKLEEKNAAESGDAKKDGEIFLQENAKRPEVKTTESGLQYEVIKDGNGEKPKSSDTVRVHYHGTLTDGTVFDSSVQRNTPAEFGVTQVIKGWVEALQMMNTGSKWKLFIPSELAYGQSGAGRMIKPHSALVFEVELLDIL